MTLTRRNFLRKAGGTGAAVAAAAVTAAAPSPAAARGNKALPPQAVGLLFDSTLCIGCKACVQACKEANGMPADINTVEPLWDTPLDIGPKTLNVIKLHAEGRAETKDVDYAFVKKSCLHCVDPSCVSACPVSAMTKDPASGIVGYDPKICIGCRYCVAACPFGVPRFEYDTPVPQVRKCELCRHRLADGGIPACAEVCPTGSTLFGPREALLAEAKRRLALTPGETTVFPRNGMEGHEKAAPDYVRHVYGENEVGGTQVLLLSGVPFEKLGYPRLPDKSFASTSETIQHTIYGWMIAPVTVFAGLVYAAHRSIGHVADELEE